MVLTSKDGPCFQAITEFFISDLYLNLMALTSKDRLPKTGFSELWVYTQETA